MRDSDVRPETDADLLRNYFEGGELTSDGIKVRLGIIPDIFDKQIDAIRLSRRDTP